MGLYENNFPYSFNLVISQLIYISFVSQKKEFNIYYHFMKKIQKKEEKTNKNKHKLIDIFITTILKKNTQESFYLLEKFIEKKYINPKIIHYVCKKSLNFIHYLKEIDIKNINSNLPFSKYFIEHYEELSKNNWELHKQLIKEGVNPNEISKIIRNDEVENLQEIAANEEFDYNQIIKPSPYERCTFINKEEVSLIDYAAFFGSVKCFKFLLLNNAKVSQTCKYAVAGGNLEIIHLCEQNHSSFGNTFDVTVQFHRNDVFHYLYENQIYKTEDLTLMLKNCITYYNYELFLFLFEKNLKLSISYLYEFAKIGNLFIVKPFIDENQIFDEILTYFSESGNIELVEYILNQKIIDINAKTIAGNTALILASAYGHVEMVKLLLEQKGIDINAKNNLGNTALIFASLNGHTEIVKLLLEQKGIDINAKNDWTALMFASKNGHTEIVKLLLEQEGIDINIKDYWNGKTTLMIASEYGHTEIVKLLLEQEGIDINVKGKNGETALIKAYENRNIEIVKLLLEQEGIDINAKDWNGKTALIKASFYGHTEIVKLLLEQEGIDINAKNYWGWTALILASENGHTEIVKLLLEQEGIDINAKDDYGKTALILASVKGHTEIVKLLLEQEGIDINAKDDNGKTALMYASEKGYTEIVKLLHEKEGNDINTK